jgi:hypothetical protein
MSAFDPLRKFDLPLLCATWRHVQRSKQSDPAGRAVPAGGRAARVLLVPEQPGETNGTHTRERWHTGYENVLEIIEFKHDISPQSSRHLVVPWPRLPE